MQGSTPGVGGGGRLLEQREVQWVDRAEEFERVVAGFGEGPLALDTEADSFHHYQEKVCLIQLSFGSRDVLVDPLADLDLSVLRSALEDSNLRKIVHGADYDIRMLHRDFGLLIRGLFDTMVAARLVGERAFGLSALLDKFLDVRLEKRYQRADWSIRPLSPEMKRYAVLDTRHLETLAALLEERLQKLERIEWSREEFRRLEAVRWRAGEKRGKEPYLRFKAIRKMHRRELAVLRELAELREAAARRRDVPPFRVMRDEVVLDLVRGVPRRPGELKTITGLPSAWAHGAGSLKLLEAIERGRTLAEDDLPPIPRAEKRKRLDSAAEARLRRLCGRRDEVADKLGLEPAVLASRSVLEQVLARLESGEGLDEVPGLRRWQLGLLDPVFRAVST